MGVVDGYCDTTVIMAFVDTPAPDQPEVMFEEHLQGHADTRRADLHELRRGLARFGAENAKTLLPQAPTPKRSPYVVPVPKTCLSSGALLLLLANAFLIAVMSISASESSLVLHEPLQLRMVARPMVLPFDE